MRSRNMPTPAQLRLGSRRAARDLKAIIAAVAGDPAYLHEMEERLGQWSRKQLEKAVRPLVDEGVLVRYGSGTRRLYAKAREVPPALAGLSGVQVRLLQFLPTKGAVELADLEGVMSETGAVVDALTGLGLVVRIGGRRDVVAVARDAAPARATLGDGLALPPLGIEALHAALGPRRRARHELDEIDRIVAETIGDAQQPQTHTEKTMKKPKATPYPADRAGSLYAYLLLRTDLPSLGRGKGAAHGMHAGNHLTHELWVRPLLAGDAVDPRVEAWHAQGGGFGTTITLGKEGQVTADVLGRLVPAAQALGFLAGQVLDTSYPYVVDDEVKPLIRDDVHTREPKRIRGGWLCCREEVTAAWVLGDKAELDVLLARFDLAPND